jgi:hypothetical protein
VERALARAIAGSTIHNTAATRLTVIETQQTDSGATIGRVRAIVRVKVQAIVPAAAAPEHARVVAEQVLQVGEPETAPVVAGPERDPVVAEPELVRVVGVLQDRARNRRRVPAGPAAPTKWEIVAFPREQLHAAVPSVVGEAVAAGIMRVPAAAEVAPAWVAAGTAAAAEAMAAAEAVVLAAAVVVAAAAAAVEAAAAAGDRRTTKL